MMQETEHIRLEQRWVSPPEPCREKLEKLATELNVPLIIARILWNRGIEDFEGSKKFLRPSLENLHDPFAMADMEKAVERLNKAIDSGEQIMIYGDYDVDGVTAVSFLLKILKNLGTNLSFYIPDRLTEGYGISREGIREAQRRGVSLIVSVDCGITAVEEIQLARQLGIDVIVTDHHQPAEEIPEAVAMLDPKREGCPYPFKELAGVGVAFKLAQALFRKRNLDEAQLFEYLDLVALGTAADIVPLRDENRILTKHGIDRMAVTSNLGLRALLENTGLTGKLLGTGHLVFIIAPRINAVGRMGNAGRAVRLLTTENEGQARNIAKILEAENRKRKGVDDQIFSEASRMVTEGIDRESNPAIVLASEDWHPGVIGIVASRIAEEFYLPTILIALDGEEGRGSGRSIPDFDIYKALKRCKHSLLGFGGHKYAAGLSIKREKIEQFREDFQAVARSVLHPEQLIPKLKIDAEINLGQIDHRLVRLLRYFAPYGPQNMRPVMVSRNLEVVGTPMVVGKEHLRFKVRQGGAVFNCIGFRMGHLLYRLIPGEKNLDMVYVIEEDNWQGEQRVQLRVKDVR
ncbi:MAG: single-stranded-DNA-specific exonuclease RecJ [Candidatus Latescibacterota bacterium]|nr:MAG: single-stranded-DNA-specific exonuclease RecJ [Candidatus Latescibacterota bacterium]